MESWHYRRSALFRDGMLFYSTICLCGILWNGLSRTAGVLFTMLVLQQPVKPPPPFILGQLPQLRLVRSMAAVPLQQFVAARRCYVARLSEQLRDEQLDCEQR